MKTKVLVGALIVLVIMNIAALGTFWYMHHQGSRAHRHWATREGREQRWEGHKKLSREERRRVYQAMRSLHEEVRPLIDDTEALEGQLIAALKQDPVPRARIDSLHEQIAKKRLEIAKRATDHMIAMSDSLSPPERERMIDAIARFRRGSFDGSGERHRWRHDRDRDRKRD
ncbi:MAG TPA: periplasmic heavy metal sensor [Candidatus Krumholzibacteria bacterium]